MKLASACVQCRSGKRKCGKSEPGTACEQCIQRSLPCSSFRARVRTSPAKLLPLPEGPVATVAVGQIPPVEVVSELIELYIYYIHDKPHSLFHEPSLRKSAADGTLSKAILFAICGLSARFSSIPHVQRQGKTFTETAKRLIQTDLENICLENVQACVLVGNICLAEGNPDSESLYFVIANRMAQLLGLSKENPADESILREVKRRVWWSLYLIDRWASAGLGLPRQFYAGGFAPERPMDELIFLQLVPGGRNQDPGIWQPGIWSHMCSLVRIFGHIQDFNKLLVEMPHWDENEIEIKVLALAEQLSTFERELPLTLTPTPANFDLQAQQGVGRTFVALHLGYHHYATLLYYQYLDQRRPNTYHTKIFAERCKYHATMYCELLRRSHQQPQCEALYNIVGHMTVVSSSVLLHTLLLGEDDELPMARERLESNFEHLVHLQEIWPSVTLMMKRLIIFQNACLRTAQLGTHRFDKWMVKFLLQHALTLDEKNDPSCRSEPSPLAADVEDEKLRERSKVTENIIRTRQRESGA